MYNFCLFRSLQAKELIVKKNPHLEGEKHIQFGDYTNVIDDDYPSFHTENKFRSVEHLGQRKLLIQEIMFLTRYSDKGDIVLYVGASPGLHIPLLSILFPDLTFILYDPSQFGIKNSDKIKIYNKLFTDDELKKYMKDKDKILFVSDIRNKFKRVDESASVEEKLKATEIIDKDMQMQYNWVKTLKPKMSMLKFKLPYSVENVVNFTSYNYLDGEIWIQGWGGFSNETRLITDGRNDKIYNPHKYNNQVMYHNNVSRYKYYQYDDVIDEYDHCYDCYNEIQAYNDYIYKFNSKMSLKEFKGKCDEYTRLPLLYYYEAIENLKENNIKPDYIEYDKFKMMINSKRLKRLRELGSEDNILLSAMTYSSMMSGGQQWSIPLDQYQKYLNEAEELEMEILEGFGSPFNSQVIMLGNYKFCSLYPHLDSIFGGISNFFDTDLTGKYVVINPPFILTLMEDMTNKAIETMKSDIRTILILWVPKWSDASYYQKLESIAKEKIELKVNEYYYESNGQKILANFPSTIFRLEN